ncbi:MAG: sodium:calcium antiporter, partial [SAR324 cluster bacterium]|nr:sodium:calcium antiporter [SAR324 cluster bacterium]
MNPIAPFSFFFGKDMFRHAILLSGIAIIAWFLTQNGIGLASYFLWISLIMMSTIVIWRAGDFFSPAASYIQ